MGLFLKSMTLQKCWRVHRNNFALSHLRSSPWPLLAFLGPWKIVVTNKLVSTNSVWAESTVGSPSPRKAQSDSRWTRSTERQRDRETCGIMACFIDWVSNKLCNYYLHQLHEITFNKWINNDLYTLAREPIWKTNMTSKNFTPLPVTPVTPNFNYG